MTVASHATAAGLGARRLTRSPSAARIVALGGGTGLSTLLRGLRAACFPPPGEAAPAGDRDRVTAIVTVADDGGSSGALRRAYAMLAPGDIRNCLLALAGGDATMQALFNFRFNGGVGGHSLGNLILTALSELEQDFSKAVQRAGEILNVQGRVLPCTAEQVALQAEFADGSQVRGESNIPLVRRHIRRVSLAPANVRALPEAIRAVEAADVIVIGPGSLYTSLIPNLLVQGMADSIARSGARVVLIMNLMTEPGETDGYSAADFVLAIHRHAPQIAIDTVLFNRTPIPAPLAARYAADGAAPVMPDHAAVNALGCRSQARDLLAGGVLVRHDPHKLANALMELLAQDGGQRQRAVW